MLCTTYNLPLSISAFFSENNSNLNAAAAALIIVLPLVVVYLCLQRYFVRGLVDSAIK